MIEALFNSPNFLAAKQLLQATEMQHLAIASNLANAETPNYKRIQVNGSFAEQLHEAVRSQDTNRIRNLSSQLEEDPNAISSRLDGNTVVMDKEMLQLMQNSVDHAIEVQLLTGNLARLRLAVTGRS